MNCNRGFKLAGVGASFGCPHNKGVLGCCLVLGRGAAKDGARGFELARESSAAGSGIGHFLLGLCYFEGRGVAADRNLALQAFRLDLLLFDNSDDFDEDPVDWMKDCEDFEEENEDDSEEEEEEEAGEEEEKEEEKKE